MMEWTPAPSTGEPRMDAQHRELFRRAGVLVEVMRGGDPTAARRSLDVFEACARHHFADERAYLDAISHPASTVHGAAHDRFVRELAELRRLFDANGPSLTIAIRTQSWLADRLELHARRMAGIGRAVPRPAPAVPWPGIRGAPGAPARPGVARGAARPARRSSQDELLRRAAEQVGAEREGRFRPSLVVLASALGALAGAALVVAVLGWDRGDVEQIARYATAATRKLALPERGAIRPAPGAAREGASEVEPPPPPHRDEPVPEPPAPPRRTSPPPRQSASPPQQARLAPVEPAPPAAPPPAGAGSEAARAGSRPERAPSADLGRRVSGGRAFGGARWGTELGDILAAFGSQATLMPAGGDGARAHAVIHQARFGSRSGTVRFYFDDAGRLGSVQIQLVDVGDRAAAFDDLAAWLGRQYGEPATSRIESFGAGTWSRRALWRTFDSEVELDACDGLEPPTRILYLDVKRGEISRPEECAVTAVLRPAPSKGAASEAPPARKPDAH